MYKIVIDAGHGGGEAGAVGPTGLKEKDVNLRVALHLKEFLKDKDFEVFMTRESDTNLTLSERVLYTNKINPDIFISIHHNSNAQRNNNVNRAEIYVPFNAEGPCLTLGHYIRKGISDSMHIDGIGPIPAKYTVLNNRIPVSVLVEPAYIINHEQEAKLRLDDYLRKEATALGQSVIELFRDGGDFRFYAQQCQDSECLITFKSPIFPASLAAYLDGKKWEHIKLTDNKITVRLPSIWKNITIQAFTESGVRFFPFKKENKKFKEISSFTQSIREFGNLKLLELHFLDELGCASPQGLGIEVVVRGATLVAKSPKIEEHGRFYVLVNMPSTSARIEMSNEGFQGVTEIRAVEKLRGDEIAGILVFGDSYVENALVKSGNYSTVTDRFGVFKIKNKGELNIEKEGFESLNLDTASKEYPVIKMKPLYKGKLLHKKVRIFHTEEDTFGAYFADFLSNQLARTGMDVVCTVGHRTLSDDVNFVREIEKTRPDISFKIEDSTSNAMKYYYRDDISLSIAQHIMYYFNKVDMDAPLLQECSEYFIIHPTLPRIVLNVKDANPSQLLFLTLPVVFGLIHYFTGRSVQIKALGDISQESLLIDENGFLIPRFKNKFYLTETQIRRGVYTVDGRYMEIKKNL